MAVRGDSRNDRRSERPPPPPLDAAALERLALRYVERFATTRGKLADYLHRKIRERGWDGDPADPQALAQRMADLGYVDDRLYAESKAAAMARKGLGARRVTMALRQAHIDAGDAERLAPAIRDQAQAAALTFARRKRIGPFGAGGADRAVQERQLAAMVRAGHDFRLARRIVTADSEEDLADSW